MVQVTHIPGILQFLLLCGKVIRIEPGTLHFV
jgi:hypothetical protein